MNHHNQKGSKMKTILCLLLLASLSICFAQDVSPEYVGNKKCKMCHNKVEKGEQFNKWLQTGHAQAIETLKSPEAQVIAKERGLTTTADKAPECVVCHTTGFGSGGYEIKDEAFWSQVTDKGKPTKEVKRMSDLQSVGCESCHGAGSMYKSKKVKLAITAGEAAAADYGLLTVDENTCTACHNEDSPTYKPFDFKERLAKIAHPYPDN